MKLLITGGAGFIGSEFVRQAVKLGYSAVVVDKLTYAGDLERLREVSERIVFYRVDITDFESLKEVFESQRPEAVVHFAAESHVDRSILNPYDFLNSNVVGTYNLCELSRRYKIEKFINISTDEVYGELGKEGKFTEQSPLNPNSPYSVSKASADMLARAYFRTYGLPVITVRPSNNYGAWQYPEKLIPVVIAKALLNEPVPVYGDGSNIREWLYVEDCAEAIFSILEKGKIGEIYNVSSGEERRNIEVVTMILKLLNKSSELISFVKDRPGHDFRYSSSFEKLKNKLSWKLKTTFEEGLEKTVSWYLNHQDWLFRKINELKEYWERVYNNK